MNKPMSIRVRPFIRYLGALVPLVAGLPSALGLLWLLTHPADLVANWGGLIFAVPIFLITFVGGFRWLRIGADINDLEIAMRGFLRSCTIRRDNLAKLETVRLPTSSGGDGTDSFHLLDRRGERIGTIPGALEICPQFEQFKNRLYEIAAENRKRMNDPAERDIRDLPVDEWTAEDLERYENEDGNG